MQRKGTQLQVDCKCGQTHMKDGQGRRKEGNEKGGGGGGRGSLSKNNSTMSKLFMSTHMMNMPLGSV